MNMVLAVASQVVGTFGPLLIWTVVLGIGAVTLPRSKVAGTLVMIAAALSLAMLFFDVLVGLAMYQMASSGSLVDNVELYLIAKQVSTTLARSLVHILLLVAVFWGREPAVDDEE